MGTKTRVRLTPEPAGPAARALSRSAVVVIKHVHTWSGRMRDKDATATAERGHGAQSGEAGDFMKAVAPKGWLAPWTKATSAYDREFRLKTFPSPDGSGHILSTAVFLDHMRRCNDAIAECHKVRDQHLVPTYAAILASSPRRLGTMFNAAEFPAPGEIVRRFSAEHVVLPFADAAGVKFEGLASDIRSQVEDDVRASLEAREASIAGAARMEVCRRIVGVLQGTEASPGLLVKLVRFDAADAVDAKGNRVSTFRDSAVQNVRDLLAVLPALDVTADPEVARMTAALETISAKGADTLRSDDGARAKAKQEAARLLSKVSSMLDDE